MSEDAGLDKVLRVLGVAAETRLGHGGEAVVFALDDERVLRVLYEGGSARHLLRRRDLVAELTAGGAPFALPEILEVGEVDGRVYALIERRLPGHTVADELRKRTDPSARARVVEAHLDAAAALGDLHLAPRGWFGDLLADEAVTAPTWRDYLRARAATSLSRSVPDFGMVDPLPLADALPETGTAAFVHLDAFAGNMLTDGTRITAVLDIGATSVAGDRRLDPVAAAVYLASPEITGVATARDADVATSWLRNGGLYDLFEPAQRWLAAYWTFADHDPRVLRWCRRVLLAG